MGDGAPDGVERGGVGVEGGAIVCSTTCPAFTYLPPSLKSEQAAGAAAHVQSHKEK